MKTPPTDVNFPPHILEACARAQRDGQLSKSANPDAKELAALVAKDGLIGVILDESWSRKAREKALNQLLFKNRAELDRLAGVEKERDEWKAKALWLKSQDEDDKWTPAIAAAHPTETGKHKTYVTALDMVGKRQSKYGLVDLVNWLLSRAEQAEAALHQCYAATGHEAGDIDDFRAFVDREKHTIEAVREMRADLDKAEAKLATMTKELDELRGLQPLAPTAGFHGWLKTFGLECVRAGTTADLAANEQIAALRADKERLDWAEQEHAGKRFVWIYGTDGKKYCCPAAPGCDERLSFPSIRAATDAARQNTSP